MYFGPLGLDYPEEAWMHCMVEGWCTTYGREGLEGRWARLILMTPSCNARPTELLDGAGPLRSVQESQDRRAAAREQGSHAHQRDFAKAAGLHLESVRLGDFRLRATAPSQAPPNLIKRKQPWYSHFEGVNGHALNTADILHQVLNGTSPPA